MFPSSFKRRADHLREHIDDPACDRELLFRTYRQFTMVNVLLSGWRRLYRELIRPALGGARSFRVLDIGFGGGDILRRLSQWADRDGLHMEALGIDTERRTVEYAEQCPRSPALRFELATAGEVAARGERFDFVLSNNVLHHLSDTDVRGLAEVARNLATRTVIFSDIRRSALGYVLFAVAAPPLMPRSYAYVDGLTSVRRSFTDQELKAVLPAGWQVTRMAPFRLLAVQRV